MYLERKNHKSEGEGEVIATKIPMESIEDFFHRKGGLT